MLKVFCKYCPEKFRGDWISETTHLWNHYKKKHDKKGQESIRQKLLRSNFNKEHPEVGSYTFNNETTREELAKAIIMHEYSLSIVYNIGFKRYSSYLQPLFKVHVETK